MVTWSNTLRTIAISLLVMAGYAFPQAYVFRQSVGNKGGVEVSRGKTRVEGDPKVTRDHKLDEKGHVLPDASEAEKERWREGWKSSEDVVFYKGKSGLEGISYPLMNLTTGSTISLKEIQGSDYWARSPMSKRERAAVSRLTVPVREGSFLGTDFRTFLLGELPWSDETWNEYAAKAKSAPYEFVPPGSRYPVKLRCTNLGDNKIQMEVIVVASGGKESVLEKGSVTRDEKGPLAFYIESYDLAKNRAQEKTQLRRVAIKEEFLDITDVISKGDSVNDGRLGLSYGTLYTFDGHLPNLTELAALHEAQHNPELPERKSPWPVVVTASGLTLIVIWTLISMRRKTRQEISAV